MEISIDAVFWIMDAIVDYSEYNDILEENENCIKTAKTEHELSNIVANSKKSINKWYKKILFKSGLFFCILLILTYIIYHFCFKMVGYLIYNLVVTFLVMFIIYVLIYIAIKILKKDRVKKEIYMQIDDYAYKYGIHVDRVYAY